MSSQSVVVVRFPDGNREFHYPSKPLAAGDKLWHEGERYIVIHAQEDGDRVSVTVELDSIDLGDLLESERGGIQLVPVG